jgi:hypothetical protein
MSTAGYMFTACVGSWRLPWYRHARYKESRFYVSFEGRGNRGKVTYPRSEARWSVVGIEPTDHETTKPRRPCSG